VDVIEKSYHLEKIIDLFDLEDLAETDINFQLTKPNWNASPNSPSSIWQNSIE
jgi:hypothetical protein